ncbi:YihY family inner membrane protein [Tranquillimonas rosea]|uniref:YihY family inner membrane protein n=1 Tax=Tranquillimonas rosea TaxID=641238 RepID=UPI0015A729E4|nr:YihY family inner membrane protein [Tranquillimonas rosea]
MKFAVQRFFNDGLSQAAGALTYSTLLALVPLLVITFAVLSGFAAFDDARTQIEDVFFRALVPEAGAEVERYLTDFAGNATNLTAVGTVALAVTAVLLLSTIETTLNQVWHVERPRPFAVRMLIFWTILTLGPLLLGASFAQTSTTLTTIQTWGAGDKSLYGLEESFGFLSWLFGLLLQILAFTLLYMLVPARPVRLREAAIGGVISGLSFEVLSWGFNSFLTSGSTYETIYGAVAVIPIFLVWVYASWTVIIIGAVFAASFPDWWKSRDSVPGFDLRPAERLEVAVAVLSVLAERARIGGTISMGRLQEVVPLEAREEIMETLIRKDWIVATETEGIVLARDLHTATLTDLAVDLGLSLGSQGPHREAQERLNLIEACTGALPDMLTELDRAEASVLDRDIASVLAGTRGAGETGAEAPTGGRPPGTAS